MSKTILLSLGLFLSFNASACDDKPCEKAYTSATVQYMSNSARRAKAYRLERVAYSKVRELRDYALYQHIRLLHPNKSQKHSKQPLPLIKTSRVKQNNNKQNS